MSAEQGKALEWAKFLVGAVLFGGMLYIHAYVKELSIFLMAVPGLLMGVDLSKYIPNGGKK